MSCANFGRFSTAPYARSLLHRISDATGGQLIRANGARLEWWDLDTGRKARSPLLVLEGGPIVGLAVSPDGNVVAARQSSHQGVRIIHLDKIGKSHRIGRHRLDDLAFGVRRYGDASELGLAFSSDGRYVRAGGSILDLDQLSRDEVWRSGTRNCVGDVVFGPEDRTLRCARDGITVLSLGAFRNPVQLISEFSSKAVTSADGTTLAVWHRDYRGVEIWDPIKRTLRGTLPIFEAGWRSAGRFELSEDGRLLAYLHTGGDIDIWDVDSATKKTTLKTGHKLSHNTPAAFSPDGRTLAVAALSEGGL